MVLRPRAYRGEYGARVGTVFGRGSGSGPVGERADEEEDSVREVFGILRMRDPAGDISSIRGERERRVAVAASGEVSVRRGNDRSDQQYDDGERQPQWGCHLGVDGSGRDRRAGWAANISMDGSKDPMGWDGSGDDQQSILPVSDSHGISPNG